MLEKTAIIILSVLALIVIAFAIYRHFTISKMTYSETLEKLRRSRRSYSLLPFETQTGIYGRSLLKSIKFLENRLNILDKEIEQNHA